MKTVGFIRLCSSIGESVGFLNLRLWDRAPSESLIFSVVVMFKRVTDYLDKVVKSHTGVSSMRFIVVLVGVVSVLLLLTIGICWIVEIIHSKQIQSDLTGYAAVITSIAGLLASVVIPLAVNKYSENKYKKDI